MRRIAAGMPWGPHWRCHKLLFATALSLRRGRVSRRLHQQQPARLPTAYAAH